MLSIKEFYIWIVATPSTKNLDSMSIAQILFAIYSCVTTKVRWLQLPDLGAH